MNRRPPPFVLALLLSLPSAALAAEAGAEAPGTPAAAATEGRGRVAIWLHPIGALFNQLPLQRTFVPIGVALPFSERLELNAELTPGYYLSENCQADLGCPYGQGVYVGAGVTWHSGDRRLNGFFIHPKVVFAYFDEGYTKSPRPNVRVEYSAGLDVGYQFTVGHLYIAPMLGVRAGGGSHGPVYLSTPTEPFFFRGSFWSLNLNLLRVGAAF